MEGRALKYYSKVLDGIQAVCKWIMIVSMFAFTAVIIVSVFFRYVLENSLTWSEQVSRFLFVWVIMLGIPIIYREKIATDLDLVTEHFPPIIRQVVAILMDILIGVFAVYYGNAGLRYTIKAGKNIFQGLNIPSGYIYASEVACGAILLLFVFERIGERIGEIGNIAKSRKEAEN